MANQQEVRIGPAASNGVVIVGAHAAVCEVVEVALTAAGFDIVPAGVATETTTLSSLRPLALVFEAADDAPAAAIPSAWRLRQTPLTTIETASLAAAILRREGLFDTSLRIDDVVVDPGRRTVRRGGETIELGRREFDALVVLLRNQPRVVTKRALLESVWDYTGYDPNVVEVAISGLRRKLESHGPRVIQTIRGLGYAARVQ